MFAVFCFPKKKNRNIDPPCLDPMDFGTGKELLPELLLRRGRVGLFATREQAESALARTGKECAGEEWTKTFAFVVLECVDRSKEGES